MSAAFAPFVMEEEREQWGVYSRKNQGWIENSAYLKKVHPVHRDALHNTIQDHEHDRRRRLTSEDTRTATTRALQAPTAGTTPATTTPLSPTSDTNPPKQSISRTIYRWENGQKVPEIHEPGQLYAPLWQVSPADYGAVNVNILSDPRIAKLYRAMREANKGGETNKGVLSSNFEVQDMVSDQYRKPEKLNLPSALTHTIYCSSIFCLIQRKSTRRKILMPSFFNRCTTRSLSPKTKRSLGSSLPSRPSATFLTDSYQKEKKESWQYSKTTATIQ